jgi:hypothetical protein
VALLGVVLIGVAIVYGWIAGGITLGDWVVRYMGLKVSPSVGRFGGTFILMLGVNALSVIPMIGGLIGILVAVVGLGAVFLTRFGLRQFIPATQDPLVS